MCAHTEHMRTMLYIAGAIVGIIIVILAGLGVYWIKYLHTAHSTFEHYYAFRGCVQLIERTDTYGTCKLEDGSVIKLVLYKNRWFLDGDLPTCIGSVCF